MAKQNLQERAAHIFSERADRIAKRIAEKIGQPTGVKNVGLDEELRLWNLRDPSQDPSALLQQNMPIDQIVDAVFPYRRKMVMFGRPDPKDQVEYAEKMAALTKERGVDPWAEDFTVKGEPQEPVEDSY